MKQFEPEIHLDHADRAQLVHLTTTEGFKILNRMMRAEVDKFVLAHINADAGDESAVLASHKVAKAAAQFYEGIISRVNEEVALYASSPKVGEKPVDVTEGLIDMDSIKEATEELPDILGGEQG